MTTANEGRCNEHAAFRYTWPGRDESYICADCAQKLVAVANAIGLHLQLIPLAYGISDPMVMEFPTCHQRKSQ